MSEIPKKTTIEADVHAKGIVTNLFNSFLNKLGDMLLGDFKMSDVTFKPGQSPFNIDQLKQDCEGLDPIFYLDYKDQEEENNRWETENNPDEHGYVNSEPQHQVVVYNTAEEATSKKIPDLKIWYAPICSKGYEGFVVIKATYSIDGKAVEKQDVCDKKKLNQWISKIKETWGIDSDVEPEMVSEEANASTQMIITLQKVMSSTSYDIALTKINANYDLSQVSDDLEAILSDDGFVESVPEEETTYVVVTDEDGALDITSIEESDSSVTDIYQELLNKTADMIDYLRIARWGAKGTIRTELMSIVENMRWSIESIQDKLGEWIISETQKAPQIIHTNTIVDLDNLTAVEIANEIQDKVSEYIGYLDLVYVDLAPEQQSFINSYKESISSLCKYSLGRLIMQ